MKANIRKPLTFILFIFLAILALLAMVAISMSRDFLTRGIPKSSDILVEGGGAKLGLNVALEQ